MVVPIALADALAGLVCLVLSFAWFRWHPAVLDFYSRTLRLTAPPQQGRAGRLWWPVTKWGPVVLLAVAGVTAIVDAALSV